jgi:cytochrome c peroxidase
MKKIATLLIASLFLAISCKKDDPDPTPIHKTTPYTFKQPQHFPQPYIPADNPMTVEGVKLGRHLYYETSMSVDNTISCASCHQQTYNFSTPAPKGTGVNGQTKNSVMIQSNLAWQQHFLWDGHAASIEHVAEMTITDPVEMNNTWEAALNSLKAQPKYVALFNDAFGPNSITKENTAKALGQFVRTMISADSRFDKWQRGEVQFTQLELTGYDMFNSEEGDCFHCHGDLTTGNLFGAWGDLQFSNNGIDSVLTPGAGLENVTGDPNDRGKFKIPSLRNVEYSFPYMHDGRFSTLQEVIEFYNMGGHLTATIDPNMKKAGIGRNWSQTQKDALLAFLKTLTDNSFVTDTSFTKPL